MPSESSRHLYIHIPFCDGKCIYCGFYSEIYSEEIADRYIDSLAVEFDQHLRNMDQPAPETIYIGGGTPAVLTGRQIRRLSDIVTRRISMEHLTEWTIETNPGSLTADKIRELTGAGVTRISMGAQSFSPDVLKRMGRRHTVEDISRTADIIRSGQIKNLGIDLIASFPQVDAPAWLHSLQSAVSFNPEHISVYTLSVEKSSRLYPLARKGSITLPNDDEQVDNEIISEAEITGHGYERYEISNYAKPGFECKHNLSCWQGRDFLGLGASASSRAGLKRWTNRKSISSYIDALCHDHTPPRTNQTLSGNDDLTERLIFGFRMKDGVDLTEFTALFRPDVQPQLVNRWLDTLQNLSGKGITVKAGNRWKLTGRGRLFADYVASELIDT